MKLPSMVYTTNKKSELQNRFGGLMHNDLAGAEDLYDMLNLSSDRYPLLTSRPLRYCVHYSNGAAVRTLTAVGNVLYFVQGDKLCCSSRIEEQLNGSSLDYLAVVEELVTVKLPATSILVMGERLILMPGMQIYNTETGELRSVGAEYSGAIAVSDGYLYEETAAENRLTLADGTWEGFGFRVGDGVTITLTSGADGSTVFTGSAVIRALDGASADFYENSFPGLAGGYNGTVARPAPSLSSALVCGNRLFGCGGDTVYASKLGDPFNFYVYDGISTDAWSVNSGTGGLFTGCCEYLGKPYFFKSDAIFKLYGTTPAGWQLQKTDAYGVKDGSGASLAVVGDTLYYQSPAGVCAYTGGYPSIILTPAEMGGYLSPGAWAAGDGHKYYLRLMQTVGNAILWVYDTEKRTWHKEDGSVTPFVWTGFPGTGQRNLYGIASDGIWLMGTPAFSLSPADGRTEQRFGHAEDPLQSFAEFGAATHDLEGKILWGLMMRLEVASGARLKVEIAYDGGSFQEIFLQRYTVRQVVHVPVKPASCDSYRLRLSAKGEFVMLAIQRIYSVISKNNSNIR